MEKKGRGARRQRLKFVLNSFDDNEPLCRFSPVFCSLFSSFSFSLARHDITANRSLVDYVDRSHCGTPRTVASRARSSSFHRGRDISRSWDRSVPQLDIVSGLSTCTRVSSIRLDHGAGSRRCFRRFALVCHNCFRPSSRLRHLDIVSFRYFRFQAHRSMSALPSPLLHYSPGNVCFYARLAAVIQFSFKDIQRIRFSIFPFFRSFNGERSRLRWKLSSDQLNRLNRSKVTLW